MLCCFPTLWRVLGGWKLEANRGGLGMLRAACVLVSGARGDPSSGLGRGLPFSAGASQPSPAPGPGSGGRAGNRRFREIVASPAPARAAPLPCNSAPRGCSCRGAGGWWGWSAIGLLFAPGRIFSCLARPAYLHLCLFGGCSRLADLDPLLSGRVKTGTVLAIGDDNKSPHVAVCGSATLHFQPSTGRPSFLSPPAGQRPAASLASHAGVPPQPLRYSCTPELL